MQYTKPTKKISAPYNFKDKDGKKNIGKCLIILGVMNDIIYKAPIKFQISLQNSLDFYTRTSTFSVWKKYWCVLSNDYLQVYDQDFNSKVVGKILISDLKNVRISKDLCLDNILEFQVSTKFIPRQKLLGFDSAIEGLNTFARVPSKKAMSADEWDVSWKNGLIGHNLSNDSESLKIYLRAGSIVDLEEWRRSFEKLGVKSI